MPNVLLIIMSIMYGMKGRLVVKKYFEIQIKMYFYLLPQQKSRVTFLFIRTHIDFCLKLL